MTARASAGSIGKGAAAARIASANPTISSTVSPFMRRAIEQSGNLRVGAFSRQHFRHDVASFGAIEGFAVIGEAMQCVEDHGFRRDCKRMRTRVSVLTMSALGGRFRLLPPACAPRLRFQK